MIGGKSNNISRTIHSAIVSHVFVLCQVSEESPPSLMSSSDELVYQPTSKLASFQPPWFSHIYAV